MSGVKEVKWPINGDVLNIDIKNLPDHILKSYQLWQAKKRVERVNMMIKKAIGEIKGLFNSAVKKDENNNRA